MKPGFHKGFDEADRGKDVRKGQRSGKQCTTSVRRGAAANKDNHSVTRYICCDARYSASHRSLIEPN